MGSLLEPVRAGNAKGVQQARRAVFGIGFRTIEQRRRLTLLKDAGTSEEPMADGSE